MVEDAAKPRSALAGTLQPGRTGASGGDPGVTLVERTGTRLFMVVARRGQGAALRDGAKALGLELPAPSRRTGSGGLGLVGIGPDQWLAVVDRNDLDAALRRFAPLDRLCTVVRIDDARTVLRVSGRDVRNTLAKMLPVDLHPRATKPGDAAVTMAGTIPVTLWLLEAEPPTFELAVPRSYSKSFWDWLTESAAEYGCLVEEGAPMVG